MNRGLSGSGIRSSWDGTPIHYNTRNPDQYVDETFSDGSLTDPCGRSATGTPVTPFYVPCDGTVGNSRRNMLIGPGLSQWDLSLIKHTKIGENLDVELRWEVYNILNRGNFYYFPDNTIGKGHTTFSLIDRTPDVVAGNPVVAQGGPRNMNFTLKFKF